MFRSVAKDKKSKVTIDVNDQTIDVPEGLSVWAAMALADQTTTRVSPVTKNDRSAYCAMGVCFECLVEIDGLPNQQACLKKVKDGMKVKTQQITEETIAEAEVHT